MKVKSKCCAKFEHKGKACKKCPLMAVLSKKKRRRRLKKIRRKLAKAA
jgi:hypothetical protein